MALSILVGVTVLLLASCAEAAINADQVTNLPGLSWTPSFKHYSGYLNATGTKKLHYWFLESQGDPKSDPVVLWMNGGPGCSSMDGLLSEHGPFIVADDGINLKNNAYSWNKVANMLYLEAPAGVGYSYSDDKEYRTNDDQVSLDNYQALKYFFAHYPEYRGNEFFVSGESYGGVYVPTLSVRVAKDAAFNFKGFIVGNGLSDDSMNQISSVYFAYYHGLVSQSLWSKIMYSCCKGQTQDPCNLLASKDAECENALNQVQTTIEQLNIYNLYDECHTASSKGLMNSLNEVVINPVDFLFPQKNSYAEANRIDLLASKRKIKEVPPCINVTAITKYMNSADVRTAIHIPSSLPEWEICSGTVGAMYQRIYTTLKAQYDTILSSGKYRIMVYNGDVDMACNFLGDQWFVDSLKQKVVREWTPWYYRSDIDQSSQIGGFLKAYQNIKFVTVKGAGHMVPTDKPHQAFEIFSLFIQNKPI